MNKYDLNDTFVSNQNIICNCAGLKSNCYNCPYQDKMLNMNLDSHVKINESNIYITLCYCPFENNNSDIYTK